MSSPKPPCDRANAQDVILQDQMANLRAMLARSREHGPQIGHLVLQDHVLGIGPVAWWLGRTHRTMMSWVGSCVTRSGLNRAIARAGARRHGLGCNYG